ncbi:receptor-like protein 9DC3 [Eucalyptus grandis]|uniref:receptor-like protein 9DC3 n=1 Tax=Eucalyptus grandis TaxID=71139 RepID=UPI00192EBCD7|nr:receptor-like protein 9DC3 [Eucalyptus grandis]
MEGLGFGKEGGGYDDLCGIPRDLESVVEVSLEVEEEVLVSGFSRGCCGRGFGSGNRLSGGFPSSFENLKHLTYLDLSGNDLYGDILGALHLKDLQRLYLGLLNLNSVLDVNDLFTLKNLTTLYLSNNNISFTKSFINATTLKLAYLYLDSCNLTEFPRSNLLETNLPIPPPLVKLYNISNNGLFGDIPTSICKVSSLAMLDLSNNALNGTLPSCLGSIGPLILLNLARNKFNGMIPHGYLDGCALRMIDVRENQLSGIVPRSLGNCKMLEYLNLGDNQINDTFPFWLSELAYLKAIGLQSNSFHGPIESNLSQLNFTSLHILDISNNNFNGEFPSNLLKSCQAMKVVIGQDELAYLNIIQSIDWAYDSFSEISMTYAMKLMNKGTKKEYAKIPEVLMAIDLSNNKFEGFIPELIGDLKSLRMLNLSNNLLNGSIPPSLANLTVLEALDLSRNNLVGEIPQQLARLTFLSVFDVSHNHLSGPIPRGTQFDTFESNSFAMNNGLCGSPLPNKCTNGENTPPPPSYFKVDEEEECLFNLDWRIVLVGTGVGFSIDVVIENLIIDEKRMWFLCCSKKMAKGWKKVRKGLADKKICS